MLIHMNSTYLNQFRFFLRGVMMSLSAMERKKQPIRSCQPKSLTNTRKFEALLRNRHLSYLTTQAATYSCKRIKKVPNISQPSQQQQQQQQQEQEQEQEQVPSHVHGHPFPNGQIITRAGSGKGLKLKIE